MGANIVDALGDCEQFRGERGGSGVLQLQLGNTNGTFYVTTNQSLTFELNLLQAQTNCGFTKAGAGTLILGGSANAQNECSLCLVRGSIMTKAENGGTRRIRNAE